MGAEPFKLSHGNVKWYSHLGRNLLLQPLIKLSIPLNIKKLCPHKSYM
jgi:hypothetical protein